MNIKRLKHLDEQIDIIHLRKKGTNKVLCGEKNWNRITQNPNLVNCKDCINSHQKDE